MGADPFDDLHRDGDDPATAKLIDRIRSRARPDTDGSDCWLYDGAHTQDGYAKINVAGKHTQVHRVICALRFDFCLHGTWQARHSCGNRGCVNPRHVLPGTAAENAEDRERHGKTLRGQQHGSSRLSEDQARAILRDQRTYREIAEGFGVSRSTVSDIKRGYSWAHLQGEVERPEA